MTDMTDRNDTMDAKEPGFAARLAAARKAAGFSQSEAAARLNVSRQALGKWEKGDSLPSAETAFAAASLFAVDPDVLLTGTPYAGSRILPPIGGDTPAARFFALRKALGLSQGETAALLGVSRQSVSKWEKGDASPDLEKLLLFSQKADFSLAALLPANPPAVPHAAEAAAETAPETTPASTAKTATEPAPETTPAHAAKAAAETATETTPTHATEAAAETAPETTPASTAKTATEPAPETTPAPTAKTATEPAPKKAPVLSRGKAKPGHSKPGHSKPSMANHGMAKPFNAKPANPKPGMANHGIAKPFNAKPANPKPGKKFPFRTVTDVDPNEMAYVFIDKNNGKLRTILPYLAALPLCAGVIAALLYKKYGGNKE